MADAPFEHASTSDTSNLPPPLPSPQPARGFDFGPWRSFFSLTGGSILYCLSALSIIYGIATILGPSLARTGILRDTYPCIAALNIYEIALMGVLAFIVVREKVTDDALSLVILVALFLSGSGLALTTVASGDPRIALGIGGVCLLLGIGKLHVLRRHIGLVLGWGAFAGLAVVLAWNFLVGPMLTRLAPLSPIGRTEWQLSWLCLLVGGILVLCNTMQSLGRSQAEPAEERPFIRRVPMVLLFAAILLIAGAVHQYVLGYVFEISSCVGDYLPLVSVVALIGLRFSLAYESSPAALNAGLSAVPLFVCGCAILGESVMAKLTPGIELLWYPPVLLGLTGIAVLGFWFRARCPLLLVVCIGYLLGVILTFGYSPLRPLDLHWYLVGNLLVATLLIGGFLLGSIRCCLFGLILGTIGFATTKSFGHLVQAWHLTDQGAVLGFAGLGGIAISLAFGVKAPRILPVLGAIGVAIFGLDAEPKALSGHLLIAAGLVSLGGLLWWRLRYWLAAAVLLVPFVPKLWILFTRMAAWRYVALSFVLLFAGAWVSVLKGRRRKSGELNEE